MRAKRTTWQREAVRQMLADRSDFISATDLHLQLERGGKRIGLATVYRALADLVASGDADTLLSPEGESLYRACESGDHHHHLICRGCGKTVEIEGLPVERWAREVAAANGFTAAAHVVDIFGLCPQCSAEAAAAPLPGE